MDDLREKVMKGLECCGGISSVLKCPYQGSEGCDNCRGNIYLDALSLLKAQGEVIDALLKVGYPHNFQREPRWIANYMYAITDVIKKAVNLKNEVPTIPEEKV